MDVLPAGGSPDPLADDMTPAYPPGLFVEDADTVMVPPEPPPAPSEPLVPPPAPKKTSHRLLIVCGSLVLVVAVVSGLLFVFQPWRSPDEVKQDFAQAVGEYQQAQAALAQKIAEAEAVQAVDAQVADPTVTDDLESAIDGARSKIAQPPAMAGSSRRISNQTEEVTRQTKACDDAILALDAAMKAVTDSRVQFATDAVNEAIASAQTALDQSKGLADESLRSALAIAIQRAHVIVDGFPTADPSTFSATVAEQQDSLREAAQAVLPGQAGTCGGGVRLPAGIDGMVCQSMPAAATQTKVTVGSTTYTQFSMPSGNVGCTKNAYGAGVICEIIRKDWALPVEVAPECAPSASACGTPEAAIIDGVVTSVRHTDVAPWASNRSDPQTAIPVLAYGQVADFSPVACLSDEDGVICWDTTTHHGFQMSVTEFTYW